MSSTLKPNYTILQLGLWLFIVREEREEQEQWSVPFSSTSLTSLRSNDLQKKMVANLITTRTPAPPSPILVNDGPIWTWRTNSKEWRRSPRSAMSPTSPRCTRRRWGWCPLVPRKLWNSILKVRNKLQCSQNFLTNQWPSLPGLRGVGAGDGSDFTVAIIEGDKNVLLSSFKSTSEQCQANYDWKVGGRLNMNCISYYQIYSIYSNWRISDGSAWGDVEKAASCEQGCQVHVHLLNKRRPCWLRQLCLLLLA